VTFKIGAQSTWQETNRDVYNDFAATGDWMRSSLPDLEAVINAGVRTCIYAGDADFIVNYMGVENMVRPSAHSHTFLLASHTDPVVRLALYAQVTSLNTNFSSLFAQQRFENFTVDGALAGLYKNAGTFSYLRVFGAGHEVPAYLWRDVPRGAAALQMFTQIMSGHQLSST